MRKIILLSIFLICSIGACFAQMTSKVDERVELTGVVFRLAKIPEYTQGSVSQYNEAIDKYFYDYRYDPVIEYVIKLRNENRLGYASVAGSALALSIENGRVIQNPQFLSSELPGLGDQWKDQVTFDRYVELLDDFYEKSNFRKFFEEHRELYNEMEAGLNELFAGFNGDWFSDFFGIPFQYPTVYVGGGNGRANYCIVDYEHDAGYAIVIGGRTQYGLEAILPSIIHEICHNYSDPLFERYWPQMELAANKIYDKDIQDEMWENAYGDAMTTSLEWLNNLCTIMYFRDNFPPLASYFLGQMRDRGFIWLPRSVQFMENFYQNRDKFPYLDSFMPQIVGMLNNTANDFDRVKFEFEHRHPYVVSVFPANGSNISNSDFNEIRVTFSKPMSSDCYSIGIVKDDPSLSRAPRSETKEAYWPDGRTIAIPIEPSQIEKNKKYGIVLGCRAFMTNDYSKMENDYTIIYNTQE